MSNKIKFYRVKKDTPMWEEGAVLKLNPDLGRTGGYEVMDTVYSKVEHGDYLSSGIIEDQDNAEFFERVYPVNLLSRTVYKIKAEAKALLSKEYTS